MADRNARRELIDARATALVASSIPKHENLTLPYEPNPNPDPRQKTLILVISLKKDGSGRFDIKSSKDMPGDMSEKDIFTKIRNMVNTSMKSLTSVAPPPSMVDLIFNNPTKVVFHLDIPNWYFTAITGNDPMTFPFFIKADANGQRDQRSFEEFRGLDNLADITGGIKDLKTIVVYNRFKYKIPHPLYFSHKFGLRMNYEDQHTINGVVVDTVTPFELDPEVKNEG